MTHVSSSSYNGQVCDAMEGGDTQAGTCLRTYLPGDFFGELALLTGMNREHINKRRRS
jgi:CRP-like cAMP-binding protein